MSKSDQGRKMVIFPHCTVYEDQFTWLIYHPEAGGSPKFRVVDNTMYALKRLEAIAAIFNADGSYNGHNERAERYGICLFEEKKFQQAVKVFEAVCGQKSEVFQLANTSQTIAESVVNTHGKLGYEGIFRYANACMLFPDKRERGLGLFMEIAAKIPADCYPVRLQDILVESLKIILKNGIKKVGDIDIVEKLDIAKEKQY